MEAMTRDTEKDFSLCLVFYKVHILKLFAKIPHKSKT